MTFEPSPIPEPSSHELTRRAFLVRAGLAGAAMSLGYPLVARGADAARREEALAHGILEPSVTDAALGHLSAPPPAASYAGLRWRHLGPFRGGRVAAVSGVPGRPNEFYYGGVNGGVWKSVDAGRVWRPVFDDQPVASIGALAVAPSRPDTVYVGTGESTLRDSTGYGNGVYKSTDAGATWTHLGLDQTHHIGKVAVDPRNPDIVFVAAIGKLYSASEQRGVFRSTNGGRTWQKVLGPNPNVGAVDVVIDPSDSKVVYAALWATRRPPWFTYAPTNGPGGGLYKSIDGGSTWTRMTKGLPAEGIGRSGIAVCPSNPKRVYAVIDCLLPEAGQSAAPAQVGVPQANGQGGVFRSDDAGATWTRMSGDPALWGRGWYFEKIAVDPKNADIVYVPNVSVSRSMDGGKTWVALRGSPGGDDYHQAWVSPDDSDTMIVASDQGAIVTRNARTADPMNVTWSSWLNQATAQVYHISVDYRFPYWVTGAQQDSGAVAVRSRGKFGQISTRDWEPIAPGGESGYTAGDPLHPGVVYGGTGERWDLEKNAPIPGTTAPRGPENGRTDWTQPLVISKADPHQLFYANQYVFRSTDGARSWTRLSDDLTRPNPGIPANLDAAAAEQVDRNGKRGVVYTVAPSPLAPAMVWVGTDDGLIHLTLDQKAWKDVTPPAVTSWSRVTMIEAAYHDVNVAYASVDRHQLEDFAPYLYRTRDMGKTWQLITKGLPAEGYCHTIKADPKRPGLLFTGTERGAYMSFDDGDTWQPLQLNLPVTSVRDFEIYGNDLIVGTHGRGIWVIDDIAPLRQLSDAIIAAGVHLFQPSDTVNVLTTSDNGTPLQKDEPQAPNPEPGVAIDYWLAQAPKGPVTIEILDAAGTVVRTFTNAPGAAAAAGGRGGAAPGRIPNTSALWRVPPAPFNAGAGMHRVIWNPVSGGGRRGGDGGGLGVPQQQTGTFTARLTVDGTTQTRTFKVSPDPRSAGLAP